MCLCLSVIAAQHTKTNIYISGESELGVWLHRTASPWHSWCRGEEHTCLRPHQARGMLSRWVCILKSYWAFQHQPSVLLNYACAILYSAWYLFCFVRGMWCMCVLVQTKARLDEFYAPFNAKLFEMLGRELRWWKVGQNSPNPCTSYSVLQSKCIVVCDCWLYFLFSRHM